MFKKPGKIKDIPERVFYNVGWVNRNGTIAWILLILKLFVIFKHKQKRYHKPITLSYTCFSFTKPLNLFYLLIGSLNLLRLSI